MISFLNQVGEIWFDFAKLLVIQNSIFLGFVFLALFLLKNASAQIKYWITLIGLFKLILPPFIPTPFIKSSSIDVSLTALSNPIEQLVVVYQSIIEEMFLSNNAVVFSIWIILTSLILLLFVFSTFRLKYKLRNASLLHVIPSSLENENSRKKYQIYQSKFISMPLTIGLFPKKIYVPENWKKWPPDCKKMILGHEMAHIKRYDGIVQFVQIIVQAIYFFNPLVWLLNRFMNKYREMACDDFAVSSSKGSSFEYSKYLTEIAEKMVSNRYKFIFVSTIFRLKFELLNRIQYQMKEVAMKRISKTKLFVIVAGLLLFILPLSLTSSQQQEKTKSKIEAQEKQKKKSVGEVFTKLFPLPKGGIKAIRKNVVYPDEAKKHGIEGKVVVKANVNTNGEVEKVSIVESPFEKNADFGCHQAAINAVKKAKWNKSSLADLENSKAGFEFEIPVIFSLDKTEQTVKPRKAGKLHGSVTDKKTGASLEAVTVILEGTGKGASTDKKGNFFIPNVNEGIYSIKVSRMGYKTVKMDNIKVRPGLANKVNFKMEPVIVQLEGEHKKTENDYMVVNYSKVKNSKEAENGVFVSYDEPPQPVGGLEALLDKVKFPPGLKKSGKNINIFVNVLVDENGDILKIKVADPKENSEAKQAAIDAIKSVKWKPAKQRDKTVKVWVEVPITFKVKK